MKRLIISLSILFCYFASVGQNPTSSLGYEETKSYILGKLVNNASSVINLKTEIMLGSGTTTSSEYNYANFSINGCILEFDLTIHSQTRFTKDPEVLKNTNLYHYKLNLVDIVSVECKDKEREDIGVPLITPEKLNLKTNSKSIEVFNKGNGTKATYGNISIYGTFLSEVNMDRKLLNAIKHIASFCPQPKKDPFDN